MSSSVSERLKSWVYEHFELALVILLVGSLVLIHWYVDDKIAFLSFYYLPVIVAGFELGRRGGVLSAVLIVALVAFFQAVVGLSGRAGLIGPVVLTLVPWAGFLILTGYVVGRLADQRKERLADLKDAYITMLELLIYHLESSERQGRGHSFRVGARAAAIARALALKSEEVEYVHVAGLLHELSPSDPRLTRLFEHFPGNIKELPVATSMRAALGIVREYAGYYEHVGGDWPVDHLRMSAGTKILAVADAFETLQVETASRAALTTWAAVEEIAKGQGITFATEVVHALRATVAPDRVIPYRPMVING